MDAIILCAGESKRLKPVTDNIPKCLLDINGTTILERHIKNLRQYYEINKIYISTGYKSEEINSFINTKFSNVDKNVIAVNIEGSWSDVIKENFKHFWQTCNNGWSLGITLSKVLKDNKSSGFIILNGDTVYHPDLLSHLINSEKENVLAVKDKSRFPVVEEDMKVRFDENNRLTDISKLIDNPIEFTGIFKMSSDLELFTDELNKLERKNNWFENTIQALLNKIEFNVVKITEPFIEIDFLSDLEEARDIFPAYDIADWEWGIRHESLKQNKRNINDALSLLKDTVDFLNKNNVKYWLNWGTLLGFYRDGGFIPWDTDIDVTFHVSDLEFVKKEMIPYMESIGCWTPNLDKCCNGDLWFIRDKEKIELNYVEPIENKYVYAPGRCNLACPKEYIDNATTVNVYGLDWAIPTNTDEYLRLSYGNDWKTPIKGNKPKSL